MDMLQTTNEEPLRSKDQLGSAGSTNREINFPSDRRITDHIEENSQFDAAYLLQCLSDLFRDAHEVAGLNVSDSLGKQIEMIVCLMTNIAAARSWTTVVSSLTLYFNNYTTKSVTGTLLEYLQDGLPSGDLSLMEEQSGELDNLTHSQLPAIIRIMRMARDNYGLLKGNALFSHFSKFLGLVVAIGFCEASSVTFSLGKFKLFEPNMKVALCESDNVFEAIFNSVTFFVERLYYCFKNKSLKPLLISDAEAADMDVELSTLTLFAALHKNGNLEDIKGVHPSEFEHRLEVLGRKLRNLVQSKTGMEKAVMRDKYNKVLQMISDVHIFNASASIRPAPFALQLFGNSGVGKSTACKQLINVLLNGEELDKDPSLQAAVQTDDKYMSNWKSNNLVMILDDFANTRPDKMSEPPTKHIIATKNNAPAYAPRAELEAKAKCAIKPELLMVTTNSLDLQAAKFSINPFSIQNRMDVVLKLRNRPECTKNVEGSVLLCADKCKAWNNGGSPRDTSIVDDIWIIDMVKPVRPDDERHTATYKPIVIDGKDCVNLSMIEVVNILTPMFEKHRKEQAEIVKKAKENTERDYELCGCNGCKIPKKICLKHTHENFEQQLGVLGDRLDSCLDHIADIFTSAVERRVSWVLSSAETTTTIALFAASRAFCNWFDWFVLIPEPWLRNEQFLGFLMLCDKRRIIKHYMVCLTTIWFKFALLVSLAYKTTNFFLAFVASLLLLRCLFQQMAITVMVKDSYRRELVRRNSIAPCVAHYRDNVCARAGKACAALGVVYILSKFLAKCSKGLMKPQGDLRPKDIQAIAQRDSEKSIWAAQTVRKLPMSNKAKSSTPGDLWNTVKNNLYYVEVKHGNKTYVANVLFLNTNVFVLPAHYFVGDVLEIVFYKDKPNHCGGIFRDTISRDQAVRIGDSDLTLCYTPVGGSMNDLREYLPVDTLHAHQFSLHYRKEDGLFLKGDGIASAERTSNGCAHFQGGEYQTLSMDTFKGLCGGVVLSHGSGSVISGFHLGGKAGTPRGCYGTLHLHEYLEARSILDSQDGIVLCGSNGAGFDPHIFGKHIFTGEPIHRKSPALFLPKNSTLQYHGSVIGRKSSKSVVRDLPISPAVAMEMDFPNCFMQPEMHPEWKGYQACLENMSEPGRSFPHKIMQTAVRDYKESIYEILDGKWNNMRPLTDQENFNGMVGVRFIDKLVEKTSTSLLGVTPTAKKHYITRALDEDGSEIEVEFDDRIRKMIDDAEDCYRRGERAWPIAIASKKDEVHSKPKCRIFYGNSVVLTWLIRKYYLPIARFLQMNPLDSECAVGINCVGPEWEQFQKHVFKFGKDRIIAGDYGKYDQKLPSQLLIAAFDILISIAEKCDYSEEDICIMKAMVSDIVYSLIAFNGDLFSLVSGVHISGNSLTVVLNGLCGSLNLRIVFYIIYIPKSFDLRIKFKNVVAAMTYGDDNSGSAKKGFDKFNIKSISRILGEYGQIYTMPDKESELVDYLPYEEFEFLKRSNIFMPELGVHVGALHEKSIFKSLHCHLRPKGAELTPEMASAVNILGALREWFFHGREVFEKRQDQLISVARSTIVDGVCVYDLCSDKIHTTFDQFVDAWKNKYVEGNDEPCILDA